EVVTVGPVHRMLAHRDVEVEVAVGAAVGSGPALPADAQALAVGSALRHADARAVEFEFGAAERILERELGVGLEVRSVHGAGRARARATGATARAEVLEQVAQVEVVEREPARPAAGCATPTAGEAL